MTVVARQILAQFAGDHFELVGDARRTLQFLLSLGIPRGEFRLAGPLSKQVTDQRHGRQGRRLRQADVEASAPGE